LQEIQNNGVIVCEDIVWVYQQSVVG